MNDVRPGGFFRRIGAFLADHVLLAVLHAIVFFTGMKILGIEGVTLFVPPDFIEDNQGIRLFWSYEGMTLVMSMAYFTYFHGTAGRTPGKYLLGLRVIRTDGTPVTPGLAFLRWVGYIVSFLPFLLGFLWIAVDRRKQGWHDKIAGTYVIREKREKPPVVTAKEEAIPPAP